ncbi:MAG: hypothetical protein RW306_07270 [Geobacteraceae bacterium]|nr:hypothetical protein [Geobacteraceae bacterium]
MGMKKNSTLERFKNRKEALLWLQSRGQISQGKFYTDCLAGHITIYPDKSLSKFQVAEYAEKVFGFARKEPPLQAVKRINRRTLSLSAGLFDSGQGLTMDTKTKGTEMMDNNNGIENVDVFLKFNTANHELDDHEPGRGIIRINAALNLSFTGNIQRMVAGLQDFNQERVTGAIAGALVELLGEGITKGGCHVQNSN